MYSNMITKIEEVGEAKTFESVNPFFVFLFSKDGESNVTIVQTKASFNKELSDTPLSSYMWNPIAINQIVITSDLLSSYRIFIGYIG